MPNNTLQQTEMCVSTGLLLYMNISKLREMRVTEGAGVNQEKLARPSMWEYWTEIPAHPMTIGLFPVFSLAIDEA